MKTAAILFLGAGITGATPTACQAPEPTGAALSKSADARDAVVDGGNAPALEGASAAWQRHRVDARGTACTSGRVEVDGPDALGRSHISLGGVAARDKRSRCTIQLPVTVTEGFQLRRPAVVLRGEASTPNGAQARVILRAHFAGEPDLGAQLKIEAGEGRQPFTLAATPALDPAGPCVGETILEMDVVFEVEGAPTVEAKTLDVEALQVARCE
jgi:hypothetical protein